MNYHHVRRLVSIKNVKLQPQVGIYTSNSKDNTYEMLYGFYRPDLVDRLVDLWKTVPLTLGSSEHSSILALARSFRVQHPCGSVLSSSDYCLHVEASDKDRVFS